MLIPHDVLIMTIDGARMSLFRNVGTITVPRLKLIHKNEAKAPPTAALGNDRPGRSFRSYGTARSAYDSPDLHDKLEDGFIADMAQLFCAQMSQSGQRAILIAPPRVLSLLNQIIAPDVWGRLTHEIAKDYAGATALELVDLLDQYER
jgi:protein required for attachment to host cells